MNYQQARDNVPSRFESVFRENSVLVLLHSFFVSQEIILVFIISILHGSQIALKASCLFVKEGQTLSDTSKSLQDILTKSTLPLQSRSLKVVLLSFLISYLFIHLIMT